MRKINLLFIVFGLALASCSPRITTQVTKSYTPIDFKQEIKVYDLMDPVPGKSEEIGFVKIGDTGFSTNCNFENVLNLAKIEARKSGGNAIKIIDHILPSAFGSSCHQITAKILKVSDFGSPALVSKRDSALALADYALLHFYRPSGVGPIISYDIHLGDTVLCRSKNNWKKTVRVKKDGMNTLWARTEAKEELPINIKTGKEYYIRSSVTMGAFIGRPKLEMVSNDLGRMEYPNIAAGKNELADKLIMNNGREVACKIIKEDSENVYFKCLANGKEIETLAKKTEIKEIIKEE